MSSSVRFRLTRASSVDSLLTLSVSIFPRLATNCWLAALVAWSSTAPLTCPKSPRLSDPKINRSMSGTTSEKKIAVRSRRYARKYITVRRSACISPLAGRDREALALTTRELLLPLPRPIGEVDLLQERHRIHGHAVAEGKELDRLLRTEVLRERALL